MATRTHTRFKVVSGRGRRGGRLGMAAAATAAANDHLDPFTRETPGPGTPLVLGTWDLIGDLGLEVPQGFPGSYQGGFPRYGPDFLQMESTFSPPPP